MMQRKPGYTRPVRQAGFTLIEIMIVVAIIAILAMIVYPNYTEYVHKSRRAHCQGALIGLGAAMERHFTANSSYKGAATGGADTGAPTIFPSECPLDGNKKYYDLRIAVASTTAYTLSAIPKGAQNLPDPDRCGTFTLTSTGVRNITGQKSGVTKEDCWQ